MQSSNFRFVSVLADGRSKRGSEERKHSARAIHRQKESVIERCIPSHAGCKGTSSSSYHFIDLDPQRRRCADCGGDFSQPCNLLDIKKGNSDPFDSRAVAITPRVNEILTFVRVQWLGAAYLSGSVIKESNRGSEDIQLCGDYLDDVCCANTFLYAFLSLMKKFNRSLHVEALHQRGESLKTLNKVFQNAPQSVPLKSVLMLLVAAVFEGDEAGIRMHGKALSLLRYGQSDRDTINILFLMRALWMDMHFLQRSLAASSDSDDWLEKMVSSKIKPRGNMSGSPELPVGLDECIDGGPLASIFISIRQYWALWSGSEQFRVGENVHAPPFESASCPYQLFAIYSQLQSSEKDDYLYTQTVVAATLVQYVTSTGIECLICGHTIFKDQRPLDLMRSSATEAQGFAARNALLWCFAIGAQTEIREGYQNGWFCHSLADLAAEITWDELKQICDGFLPVDALQPEGTFWFEKAIKPSGDVGLATSE